jgi:hypothetical protein
VAELCVAARFRGPPGVANGGSAGRSPYYHDPVFPGCFVCGPARGPGDGLRILPGPVAGRGLWAAPWTPEETVAGASDRVRPEVVWAALDCPSGIAAADVAELPAGTEIVLGPGGEVLAAARTVWITVARRAAAGS